MACVLVPAVEALVVTAANHFLKEKENAQAANGSTELMVNSEETTLESLERLPLSHKVGWLSKLLWGGSALLAFEHIWHGEISLFFPFLTGASSPAALSEMVHEMSTVGVTMSAVVTLIWAGMVILTTKMESRFSLGMKKEG